MSGKNKRKINNKIKAKEIVNTNNGNGNIIVANNYKQISYNIVNNIIKDSQSESKDEFRNLLWSLYKNTHTRKHQFYGFVNGINYKKKKFYIVNLYWRKFVYATNHVVAFYDNNCPVQIGDNIVFNGELYMYEREDGTEDIGINNNYHYTLEVITVAEDPEYWEIEQLGGNFYRVRREDYDDNYYGKYEFDCEELIGDVEDLYKYAKEHNIIPR